MGAEPGPGTSRHQRRLGERAVTGGVPAQEEPEAGDGGGRERRGCSEPREAGDRGPGTPSRARAPSSLLTTVATVLSAGEAVNLWAEGAMDVKQITKATEPKREVGCCGEQAHPI